MDILLFRSMDQVLFSLYIFYSLLNTNIQIKTNTVYLKILRVD